MTSCCPGSAPEHRTAEQLRGTRSGRDPERHQRPVPVRGQPREQVVEHAVRDLPRDTAGNPRPEQARLLPRERVHRVMVRVRPARPGQRKRVHDRPCPGLQVIGVEAPADRLAVRHGRRRVLHARRPLAGDRGRPGGRPARLVGELDPAAEVAGLGPGCLIPRNPGHPGEPEPAEQGQRVRPLCCRRASGRLQVPQELRHRLDPLPVSTGQVIRLPWIAGLGQHADGGDHERSDIPGTVFSCPTMKRDRNDPRLARPTNTQVPAVSSVNKCKSVQPQCKTLARHANKRLRETPMRQAGAQPGRTLIRGLVCRANAGPARMRAAPGAEGPRPALESVGRSWRGNLERSCRLVGVEEVGDAGRLPVRAELAGDVAQPGVGPGGAGMRG